MVDIASGTGGAVAAMLDSGAEIVGLDAAPEMLARSAVDPALATAEMARILRPGGRALLAHLSAYGKHDHPRPAASCAPAIRCVPTASCPTTPPTC